jgi:hypothetical protein
MSARKGNIMAKRSETLVAPSTGALSTGERTARVQSRGAGLTITLISLLVLLALAALGGGLSMIMDPSGAALGLDENVEYLPLFDDYLVPGVLLIILQGLVPLLLAFGLTTGFRVPLLGWAERLSGYRWPLIGTNLLGGGVVAWIVVQFWAFPAPAVAQFVILAIGVAIVVLAAMPSVRERYRIE